MNLRKTTIEDAKNLFDWRNDEETRAASINTEPINWESHLAWLRKSLSNPDRRIFIAEENSLPVGTCRIDREESKEGEIFELSWTVSPEFRGRGLGKKMLGELLGLPEIKGKKLKVVIKKGNVASVKMAEAFGFKFEEEKNGLMEWFKEN